MSQYDVAGRLIVGAVAGFAVLLNLWGDRQRRHGTREDTPAE